MALYVFSSLFLINTYGGLQKGHLSIFHLLQVLSHTWTHGHIHTLFPPCRYTHSVPQHTETQAQRNTHRSIHPDTHRHVQMQILTDARINLHIHTQIHAGIHKHRHTRHTHKYFGVLGYMPYFFLFRTLANKRIYSLRLYLYDAWVLSKHMCITQFYSDFIFTVLSFLDFTFILYCGNNALS